MKSSPLLEQIALTWERLEGLLEEYRCDLRDEVTERWREAGTDRSGEDERRSWADCHELKRRSQAALEAAEQVAAARRTLHEKLANRPYRQGVEVKKGKPVGRSGRSLRELWPVRNTVRVGCTEEKRNQDTNEPVKAWLLVGTNKDGEDEVGLGREGLRPAKRQPALVQSTLCVIERSDGGTSGKRHSLTSIVMAGTENESLHRINGLTAEDLREATTVRVETVSLGVRGMRIETSYEFAVDEKAGREST